MALYSNRYMGRGTTLGWRYISVAGIILSCCSGTGRGGPPEGGKLVFEDHFDRSELGDRWLDTGGGYRIVDGELRAKGARNKPLWLKQKLPRNAKVEFVVRSLSDAIDIKVELFGDGKSRAEKLSYKATSYVVILGGWNNSRSIIARMDEHGDDRKVRADPKGEKGRKYHFTIVRKGNKLSWYLDAKLFLEMDDSAPLEGEGHQHFAINDWESEVFFDDLKIYELKGAE
jgi:hypothetical protein